MSDPRVLFFFPASECAALRLFYLTRFIVVGLMRSLEIRPITVKGRNIAQGPIFFAQTVVAVVDVADK